MKLGRRLILAVALVAVAAAIALALRSSEPRYQGRRLSAWLDEFNQDPQREMSPAEWDALRRACTNVIQAVGTNSLPLYLKWLEASRPTLSDKVDYWVRDKTGGRFRLPQRRDRSPEAAYCFEVLGSAAEPAIPDLERLLYDHFTCSLAARSLAAIGPASLPVLSNAVASGTNLQIRYRALQALGDLGPDLKPAEPLLLGILHTNQPLTLVGIGLTDLALRALAEGETNPAARLPLFVERMADTNTAAGAAYGLALSGPAAIPVLLRATTNHEPRIRAAASAALDLSRPPARAYWTDNRNYRLNHYTVKFNSGILSAVIGGPGLSPSECQTMARVIQRYTNDVDQTIQSEAVTLLEYFNTLAATNAEASGVK